MEIERLKKANTQYLGKKILYYEKMESTQEMAKSLKQLDINNGMIILTDYQTKGRGTKARQWHSQKGTNIMMTVVLYPNCFLQNLEGLTIKIAEIVKESIRELYKIELTIKEPNDLLLNRKKIAGILTESSSYQEKVEQLLIGIGLNVNETHFKEEIADIATSLKKEYQKDFSRETIIITIIEKLEKELIKRKIIEN